VIKSSPKKENRRYLITGQQAPLSRRVESMRIVNARKFFNLIDLETDEPA
jgi:hypothetical protein